MEIRVENFWNVVTQEIDRNWYHVSGLEHIELAGGGSWLEDENFFQPKLNTSPFFSFFKDFEMVSVSLFWENSKCLRLSFF